MSLSSAILRRLMSPSRRPLKHEKSRFGRFLPHLDLRYCLECTRLKFRRGEKIQEVGINRHSGSMKCFKCGTAIVPTDPRTEVHSLRDEAGRVIKRWFRVPGRERLMIVNYDGDEREIERPSHPNWGGKRRKSRAG